MYPCRRHCHQLFHFLVLSGLTGSTCRTENAENPDACLLSSLVQLKPQGKLVQVTTLFMVFKMVTFTYLCGFVWRHLMSQKKKFTEKYFIWFLYFVEN